MAAMALHQVGRRYVGLLLLRGKERAGMLQTERMQVWRQGLAGLAENVLEMRSKGCNNTMGCVKQRFSSGSGITRDIGGNLAMPMSMADRMASSRMFQGDSSGNGNTGFGLSRVLALALGSVVAATVSSFNQDKSTVVLAATQSVEERTFIMIKPDGVNRSLVSAIIARFENRGYKLVALKMLTPTMDLAEKHYQEHNGKPFFTKLTSFLSSGPVVAMIWEGKGIIQAGRKMIGSTNPLDSAPGTIRGDMGIDLGRNIIHGSDSHENAQIEISLWFSADEIQEYSVANSVWIYE